MRWWLCVLSAILLWNCASQEESTELPKEKGWVAAGLSVLTPENAAGVGIESIVSVGDFLFARNDRQEDGTRKYQLFMGKVGSDSWKELKLPEEDVPNVLFSDSKNLWVGTFFSRAGARLWNFDPKKEMWTSVPLHTLNSSQPLTDTSFGVDGIAKFRGRLVLSFSRGRQGERNPVYFEQPDGSFQNWNRGFPPEESFLRAVEWNGALYAMTYGNGVYRFDLHDSAWHSLTMPSVHCQNGPWNDVSTLARTAVNVNDSLWVGFANLEGIFALSAQGTWSQKIDCTLNIRDEEAILVSKTPASVYRFIPFRNRVLALGEGSSLYSPKENRWAELPAIPNVAEILDGVFVKDTLYVAAFQKGVMKMSASYLESLDQNQNILSEVTK